MSTSSAPADTATSSSPSATTRTFADFGVDPLICESLASVGIIHPFPIQELTLPLALTGADIIGQARTGTGKTLGFGLPLLQRLDIAGGLQALIIVPTRELCMQVAEDLAQAGKALGAKVTALYGGKAMQPQIDALEAGAHVVVGTPGRLLDLSRRGHLDLSGCRGLVLDEADEMLDLGFLPDVEALVEQCAEDRQTLLFSATMPAQIVGLARRYMRKPTFMRADVEEVHIAPKTKQYFFSCHRMDKPAVLARILQTPDRGLCVVFCRTKRMADQLAEELRERDVPAQAIHSDLRQEARERALEKFRAGKTTVLCATEVAARGLDIDDVSHVVNYDCPDDEKMYLHRIGRTGRAGAKGVAITFAVWNELPRLEMIRRELDIEEEIHEVFSTSPLLDELFDLPAREERRKVPSPPKARTGKGSKSGRRSSRKDREADADDAAPAEERSARAGGGRRAKDAGDGDDEASRTRTRTRRRRRDDDSSDEPATADAGTDARADARTDARTDAGTDRPGRAADRDTGADDDRTVRRTRSRAAGRDDDGESDGGGRGRAADTDADSAEEGDRPRRRSRTRSTRSATDSQDAARGDDETKARKDRPGRDDSTDGGDGDRRARGGEKTQRGGRKDARGTRGKDRQSDRGSSGRDRGKGAGGSSRRRGEDSRTRDGRGRRDREGGRQRTPAVDVTVARDEGSPRLRRRMEVVHLP